MTTQNLYTNVTLTGTSPQQALLVDANETITIIAAQAINTDNTARLVTGHLVPSGQGVLDANKVVIDRPVGGNDSEHLDELFMQALTQGDSLSLLLDDVGTVNVRITYIKTT
jgi:hypothetical protein